MSVDLLLATFAAVTLTAVVGSLVTNFASSRARNAAIREVASKAGAALTAEEVKALLHELRRGGEPEPDKILRASAKTVAPADGMASAVDALVDAYHRQALEQARFQFWFSIVAATVGFIWILYAGTMAITSDSISHLLNVTPGTILDAVAFLFFRQAQETRERATALYDRLRADQIKAQAIGIVNSIEDLRLRSAIRGQLALHIVGMPTPGLDLKRFLEPGDPGVLEPQLAAPQGIAAVEAPGTVPPKT